MSISTGSYCYDDKSQNCDKYGRLYTWEAAKQACANLGSGWRLPKQKEWKRLSESYFSSLTSHNSLLNEGNSDFSAQLGGFRNSIDKHFHLGWTGFYWTNTEYHNYDNDYAWGFNFENDGGVFHEYYFKWWALSVRCIKD